MASSFGRESSYFGKKCVFSLFFLAIFIALPLYISVYEVNQSRNDFSTVTLISHLRLNEGENVTKRFAAYGYNLEEIMRGEAEVPNLFLERLPRELTRINDTDTRKDLFISSLLPPILKVNEYIEYERSRLLSVIEEFERNGIVSNNDLYWLTRKLSRYRMDPLTPDNLAESLNELHKRMNIIPPSLALTQAAIETGWGTSRFAQQANALYGQWTWNDDTGMIPRERESGETHSIKRFNNLISAVEGYALNLNTHPAYEDFRTERSKFPESDDIIINDDMLFTLLYYSERGFEYIDNLNSIIQANDLENFDNAKLEQNSFQDVRSDPAP